MYKERLLEQAEANLQSAITLRQRVESLLMLTEQDKLNITQEEIGVIKEAVIRVHNSLVGGVRYDALDATIKMHNSVVEGCNEIIDQYDIVEFIEEE